MDKVKEFAVVVAKTAVSGLVAWLAVRGLDVPEEIRSSVEALAVAAGIGLVNWVLNVAARLLDRVPGVGPFLRTVWPLPEYNTPPAAVAAPDVPEPL